MSNWNIENGCYSLLANGTLKVSTKLYINLEGTLIRIRIGLVLGVDKKSAIAWLCVHWLPRVARNSNDK